MSFHFLRKYFITIMWFRFDRFGILNFEMQSSSRKIVHVSGHNCSIHTYIIGILFLKTIQLNVTITYSNSAEIHLYTRWEHYTKNYILELVQNKFLKLPICFLFITFYTCKSNKRQSRVPTTWIARGTRCILNVL